MLPVANEPGDRAERNRLLGKKLSGRVHSQRCQLLAEGSGPKLRVGALQLARRACKQLRQQSKRERLCVMALADQPRALVERLKLAACALAHAPSSAVLARAGRLRRRSAAPTAGPDRDPTTLSRARASDDRARADQPVRAAQEQ
jgi:hypothetical protein